MDPMLDFVRDRTNDLQRLADDVHRERELRTALSATETSPAAAVAIAMGPQVDPRSAVEGSCDPCTPAPVRHAA